MKRVGELWSSVTRFDNLLIAYRKAGKGKKQRAEVAEFAFNLEEELVQLQRKLVTLSFQPGRYRQFTLYDRKVRIISAAPFADRVVHHAIMNILEPSLDKRFIHDCYACRKNKGVHAAVDRYQRWAARYAYVLKLDVQQYFPSIDHSVLKHQLQRRVKDKHCLLILGRIIDSYPTLHKGKGMAIGNLTSQFFANLYLDDMDHWLKEQCGVDAYLRYVDDLVICGDDKKQLWDLHQAIKDYLVELKLSLHPRKAQIYRTSDKLELFGYQVSRQRRWLRNENGYRFRRRLNTMAADYYQSKVDIPEVHPRIQSWIGHAMHGETLHLREKIFNEVVFTRA